MALSLGLLFWLIFILAIVFGGYGALVPTWPGARWSGLVGIVLIGILGLAEFGFRLSH